jgi:hypothetical protein
MKTKGNSDYRKLTFYYYAEEFINFDALVTDLFKVYKTRIWMAAIRPSTYMTWNPTQLEVDPDIGDNGKDRVGHKMKKEGKEVDDYDYDGDGDDDKEEVGKREKLTPFCLFQAGDMVLLGQQGPFSIYQVDRGISGWKYRLKNGNNEIITWGGNEWIEQANLQNYR